MNPRATIDWSEVRRRLEESERRLHAILNPSAESAEARLAQRAANLRSRAVRHRDVEEQQVLVFRIGVERLAIAISSVREIVPLARCTPVPGASRSLIGLHSVRGVIHSMLDPRADGDSPVVDPSTPARYAILLQHPTLSVGVAASAVERISAVAPGRLHEGELLSIDGSLARIIDSLQLTQSLQRPAKNFE